MPNEEQGVTRMQGSLANHTINEDGAVFRDNEIQKPVDGILTLIDDVGVTRRIDNQLVTAYYKHLANFSLMEVLPVMEVLFGDDKKPNFVVSTRGGELCMEPSQISALQAPFGKYSIDQHAKVYDSHGVVKGEHGFITLFDDKSVACKISILLLNLYYNKYIHSFKMMDFMDDNFKLNYSVHFKTGVPVLMLSALDDQYENISVPALHNEEGFNYSIQDTRLLIGQVYGSNEFVDLLGTNSTVSLGVVKAIFDVDGIVVESEEMVRSHTVSPATTTVGDFTFMSTNNKIVFSNNVNTIGIPLRYFHDLANKSFITIDTKCLKETIVDTTKSTESKVQYIQNFMEDLLS